MSDNKQKETPNGYDLDGYEQLKTSQPPSLGLSLRLGGGIGYAVRSGADFRRR